MSQIDHYMRQAKRADLTRDEEADLARKYRAGDQPAGAKIVESHLRFAVKLAHIFKQRGQPLEDLVQEANLGLLRALITFDPDRGYRFMTYARWWCLAYLSRYCVRNQSIVVRGTTQGQRTLRPKALAMMHQVQAEHPAATDGEAIELVAYALGSSEKAVTEALEVRVDLPLDDRFEKTSDHRPHADECLEHRQKRDEVAHTLRAQARRPRERYVIEHRMLAHDPMTLQAIAKRLGITREAVRQIEQKLIRRVAGLL